MVGIAVPHYSIVVKLGEGGIGVVHRAEDLMLTRTFALTFLFRGVKAHEPRRARFLQEACAAPHLHLGES